MNKIILLNIALPTTYFVFKLCKNLDKKKIILF